MSISEPATALPDGWAQMKIDGRLVTFDTTQFLPRGEEPVVRVHIDGRITVGPVRLDRSWQDLRPRSFWEPFAPTGQGGEIASSPVIVLGVVVA